ncbi:MAG: hypothetical protein ACMXYK_03955 [Candidatus Woesearchaeota archaeon]
MPNRPISLRQDKINLRINELILQYGLLRNISDSKENHLQELNELINTYAHKHELYLEPEDILKIETFRHKLDDRVHEYRHTEKYRNYLRSLCQKI